MSYRKGRRARGDLQDYQNQAYIAGYLDETTFDLQNTGEDVTFLYNNGALDALDIMPAGSMQSLSGNYYDRTICIRGISLKEQQDIDAKIAELMGDVG